MGTAFGQGQERSNRSTPVVRAVQKVLPSVVNISTERMVETESRRYGGFDPFSPTFERFFGQVERQTTTAFNSLGSGVVIDESGLILTNAHVVQRASRIVITVAEGGSYEAVVVATSEIHDLALLQLQESPPAGRLRAITFADPDDLLLGEDVITVGNPYGLGHSVAVGVLSARKRRVAAGSDTYFEDLIQTDAAINPGNSGGPLINVDGELIGINLAIESSAERIGFAIPVARVEAVLADWLIPSRFASARLGLIPTTTLTGKDRHTQAQVAQILADTPMAVSGVKAGEVIAAINGIVVKRAIDVGRIIWRLQASDRIRLTMADKRQVTVALDQAPAQDGAALARSVLKLELEELTPRLAVALGVGPIQGLVVSGMLDVAAKPQGPALQRGDIITQIGADPVTNFADLKKALARVHHGDTVQLMVSRNSRRGGTGQLSGFVLDISL